MIKAWLVVQFSIFIGFLLFRLIDKGKDVYKWVLLWSVMAVAVFFASSFVVVCLAAIFIKFANFKTTNDIILGYILLLPTVVSSKYFIPFPGMYYLYAITFQEVLVIAFLVPILMAKRERFSFTKDKNLKWMVYAVFGYTAMVIMLGFRDVSISEGIRLMIKALLAFLLPFLALRNYNGDMDKLFKGMLLTGLILSVMAIVEWQLFFKPYGVVLPSLGVQHSYVERLMLIRDGTPRTSASMGGPLILGFFLALVSVYLVSLWQFKKITFKKLFLPLVVILVAIESTGSRAALLTILLGFLLLFFRSNAFMVSKKFMFFLCAVISFFVVSIVPIGNYLAQFDEEGTFQYRVDLINNSLVAAKDALLFGATDYLYHPAMQLSMQGQGIIDVVNAYLQILLEYGLITLIFYVAIWFYGVRALHKKYIDSKDELAWLLIVLSLCTLFFIATCSSFRFIPIYNWILIGLIAAYLFDKNKSKLSQD